MLDTTGCARGHAIETYTGKFVDITNIAPEDIDILDIAHSLSRQCRYNGHCDAEMYSVAEHSCHVADCFQFSDSASVCLAALLHDASEAFLCDVPRPLKVLLTNYAELEAKVQKAIYEKFGLRPLPCLYARIKEADNALLKAEASALMASRGEDWGLDGVPDINVRIQCWSPNRAKQEFLERFSKWA